MASNNYVVRDIVQYIHDENEYRTGRSISSVFEKLKANLWIFIIIVGISCGAGYLAVYLPSMMAAQEATMESSFEGVGVPTSEMKNRFEKLSPEEKAALMKQLGGGLGGEK